MKTTLEIPDIVFRRSKSMAAKRGIPLREFVTEAVKDKLAARTKGTEKPWVKHMGKLKHLRRETARINRIIEEDSEQIDAEMWAGAQPRRIDEPAPACAAALGLE